MLRYFNLLIASLFVLYSSCGSCKDEHCPDELFYRVPYSLSPMKDTFMVGDTIFMEMNFNEKLIDERGGVETSSGNVY